jgi:hypothetical protein
VNVMKLGLCAEIVKQPCKSDCPNRTITCKFDGTCDKYEKFDAEVKKLRRKRFEDKKRKSLLDEHVIQARKNFTKHKVGEV